MSKSLVSLLLIIGSSLSFAKPIQGLIVGGEDATRGEFPFIVSLQSGSHFCGGSLISDEWVLTAAHCVGGSGFKVVVGLHNLKESQGSETFRTTQVIPHPQYNRSTMDYDYALVKLNAKSTFKPVAINETEISLPSSETTVDTVTAGWGYVKEGAWRLSDILQKVTVPLVPYEECNKSYNGEITERMLCAGLKEGGKDSCQGDSGGPLLVHDYVRDEPVLAGVVSWGIGCARPEKYGVYSKVNAVTEWILNTITE
ncbi:MAG: S1 family serine peptidase [Bdellovibrionales bacterium]